MHITFFYSSHYFYLLYFSYASISVLRFLAKIFNYKEFKFTYDDEIDHLTQDELEVSIALKISQAQQDITDSILQEISYWNNAYPSYRWQSDFNDRSAMILKGIKMVAE